MTKLTRTYFSLIALLITFALPLAGHAITKKQMGTVINLSGKQRMLTQKMSKEILLIAKGIELDKNKAALKKTAALFGKTLKGLLTGDASLGLPKTAAPKIIDQLKLVEGLWGNFAALVEKVLAGNTQADVLNAVNKQNIPLLKNMNAAVQMFAKSSGSSLSAGMATTINLAGKQRMLTQKMTKELLLIANGIDAKASLAKTVALFDKTLKGLFDGDNDLSLPGTKTAAIRAQLDIVKKLWNSYKPILDKVDTSNAGLKKAAELNLPLLKEMNKAVKMFEKSIK